ncbi:hypothetical protein RBSWK_03609 [Rhodopirellula baltica SWK14]|uniref:Uncharacterized protein n=1 Tax=Rhodopirellula baltica SWK14 TaxID=993516 RepID=L7CFX4_RHOBT|nr:hypothetical protein RBSWK_03609 [Rhodopirellula baltica SWK14]
MTHRLFKDGTSFAGATCNQFTNFVWIGDFRDRCHAGGCLAEHEHPSAAFDEQQFGSGVEHDVPEWAESCGRKRFGSGGTATEPTADPDQATEQRENDCEARANCD